MIFVTVGTELPFDRLVGLIDDWAHANARQDVFAQIGHTSFKPRHIAWAPFLEPPEFQRRFDEAHLVISHAGMGTILTALYAGKPLLVMPRRASLGEHRSEHQVATAERMRELGRVNVAFDELDLHAALERTHEVAAGARIEAFASQELVGAVRDFVYQAGQARTTRRPVIDRLGRGNLVRAALFNFRRGGAH